MKEAYIPREYPGSVTATEQPSAEFTRIPDSTILLRRIAATLDEMVALLREIQSQTQRMAQR